MKELRLFVYSTLSDEPEDEKAVRELKNKIKELAGCGTVATYWFDPTKQ